MKNATLRRVAQAVSRIKVDVASLREEDVFRGFSDVTPSSDCVDSAGVALEPHVLVHPSVPTNPSQLPATSMCHTPETLVPEGQGGNPEVTRPIVGRVICSYCGLDKGPSGTLRDSHGICESPECRLSFKGHSNQHVISWRVAFEGR